MKNTPKRAWVVFDTDIGWKVSYKKLTESEIGSINEKSSITLDFSNTVGLTIYENKISAYWYSFDWTRKDAEKAAKDLNLKKYNTYKLAVERDIGSEVG